MGVCWFKLGITNDNNVSQIQFKNDCMFKVLEPVAERQLQVNLSLCTCSCR